MWYYNRAPLREGRKRTLKIKQRRTNKDPTILREILEIKDNKRYASIGKVKS